MNRSPGRDREAGRGGVYVCWRGCVKENVELAISVTCSALLGASGRGGAMGREPWLLHRFPGGGALPHRWEEVDRQDVQRWMVWLLGRYSDAYVSNQYRALQSSSSGGRMMNSSRTRWSGCARRRSPGNWSRCSPAENYRPWRRPPAARNGIYQMIARRGRQCGVDVFPHRFRHHFSHTWLDRGGAEGDPSSASAAGSALSSLHFYSATAAASRRGAWLATLLAPRSRRRRGFRRQCRSPGDRLPGRRR